MKTHITRPSTGARGFLLPALFLAATGLSAMTASAAIQVKPIFSFNGTDGAQPSADLLCLSNGFIYGTTAGGGASGNGTVFLFSPVSNAIVAQVSFSPISGQSYGQPASPLMQGQDGNLYGTTGLPGNNLTYSRSIYRVSTNLAFSYLYTLSSSSGEVSGLAQAPGGLLYGCTSSGGLGSGTVFSITTNGTSFNAFESFGGPFNSGDGTIPLARLTAGNSGVLYGTTSSGGSNGCGTIFRIAPSGSGITTLYSFFLASGSQSEAGMTFGSDGCFYGTTYAGGAGYGTVFKFNPANNTLTTLHSFTNGTDGAMPVGGLLEVTNGVFYGTTSSTNNGGIYQITSGGAFSNLFTLSGINGSGSLAGLARGADGNLYGTTSMGGAYYSGMIFRVSFLDTTPPVFQKPRITSGMFMATASAVSGQSYQVQYITNLAQTNWSNLGNPVTATNGAITVSNAVVGAARFYRVLLQQ